ncbi:MAG TPA: hypothetical protein PKZ44_00235 [Flavobacterium sp.]|nr:hypothetical protein [Flavobacterium sp.]
MLRLKYLTIFFAVYVMNSCTSMQKKSFISSFDSFILDVETNYKIYKEKDWEEADLIYKNLIEVDYVKYQTSLTDAENSHVNTLIGKYQALKLKSSLFGIKKQLQNVIQQGTTIVNEIVSDTTLFNE